MPTPQRVQPLLCSTGIAGLDDILFGGFPANRFYLIQGDPGLGKTTLALQFLMEGARRGEKGLYITLSETKEELAAVADSHGWDLAGFEIIELSSLEEEMLALADSTVFHPSEIELNQTVEFLLKHVERVNPARVVFDSLSEIRLLAQNSLRYRRQMLSFKQYFAKRNTTVLLLDDRTSGESDLQIQSIAHGVLSLQRIHTKVGAARSHLTLVKLRGAKFKDGWHDYVIRTGGIQVYPRMIASSNPKEFKEEVISSGIDGLDQLLGGGLDRGTSNLFIGPAGCGKTSIACQYATQAADRGEKVAFFLFDENKYTFIKRAETLGMRMRAHIDSGLVKIHHVDAAELTPGEMAETLRTSVEKEGVRMVVIDSLNGYLNAMPEEQYLSLQMHELLSYLNQQGILSILVMAQHGVLGEMTSPADLTYLADTVLLVRFFEVKGSVKKAISVIKRRTGSHEETIRELYVRDNRLGIGPVLHEFQGVLKGVPTILGEPVGGESSSRST